MNAAQQRRNKFMMNIIDQYPDDDTTKDVQLWAAGLSHTSFDRHVLLQWVNGQIDTQFVATQVVQLTGQAGNYAYDPLVVKSRNVDTFTKNTIFTLGKFTRAQRDQILDLASKVVFLKTSTTNCCRVWTRDLLTSMTNAGLITKEKFDEIDTKVPLVKRMPEA